MSLPTIFETLPTSLPAGRFRLRDQGRTVIGRSVEGHPIVAQFLGSETSQRRILIMAGQHGDEWLARAAVADFVSAWSRRQMEMAGMQLAVVANANPDGAQKRQRGNARGIDLNRDHQLLFAPETQAVHRLARTWHPHVVIDVHTYPPRRRRLLKRNLVHCHDVYVDCSNNPAACAVAEMKRGEVVNDVVETLRRKGFQSHRYLLITASGRVRHSTPDVVDARNALALRYGVSGFLLEGRQPTQFDGRTAARRTRVALRTALERLLQRVSQCESLFASQDPRPADASVAIGSQYVERPPEGVPFYDLSIARTRLVQFDGPYSPHVEVTHRAAPTQAYAVPTACSELIDTLKRHGFHGTAAGRQTRAVEVYRILDVEHSLLANRPPRRLGVICERTDRRLDGYRLYACNTETAPALAVFLEPQSKYGLHRFSEIGLFFEAGVEYPVLRVSPAG